jgi:hypothetical protein
MRRAHHLPILAACMLLGCAELLGIEPGALNDGAGGESAGGSGGGGAGDSGGGGGAGGSGGALSVADLSAAVVMADDPLAYSRLDEPEGVDIARDEVTDAPHDGVYEGGIMQHEDGLIPGSFAVFVPNTLAAVHVVVSGLDDFYLGDFTIEAWIKPSFVEDSDSYGIVDDKDAAGGINFGINSGGKLQLRIDPGPDSDVLIQTSMRIVPGEIVHVAVVVEGGTVTLYIGGAEKAQGTPGEVGASNSTDLVIGSFGAPGGAAAHFNGVIDEVAIYDYALSPQQLLDHASIGEAQ